MLELLGQHQEPVDPADGGYRPRHRSRREAARDLTSNERLERRTVEPIEPASMVGRVSSECAKIASVALDRPGGQTPLDAEMVEIGVNHRASMIVSAVF
jgi:hypothetical protein